jgi:hypothetical protein
LSRPDLRAWNSRATRVGNRTVDLSAGDSLSKDSGCVQKKDRDCNKISTLKPGYLILLLDRLQYISRKGPPDNSAGHEMLCSPGLSSVIQIQSQPRWSGRTGQSEYRYATRQCHVVRAASAAPPAAITTRGPRPTPL